MIFQTEKQIKEFSEKLTADNKMKIETALGRLKEAVKGTNTDEIKSSMEAVNAAWNEASTQMYSQATGTQGGEQQQGGNPETESQQKADDDKKVENADFEVVDDEKK